MRHEVLILATMLAPRPSFAGIADRSEASLPEGAATLEPVAAPSPRAVLLERRESHGHAILLLGATFSGGPLPVPSGSGYVTEGAARSSAWADLLDGPLIRLMHGQTAMARASLGLRALFPITGAAVGAATCDDDSRGFLLPCFGEAAAGFAGGLLAVLILDPDLLAWRDVDSSSSLVLRPRLRVKRDGVILGVHGTL